MKFNARHTYLFHKFRYVAEEVAQTFEDPSKKRTREETQNNADFALVMTISEIDKHNWNKLSLEKWIGSKVFWYMREIYSYGVHKNNKNLREPMHHPHLQQNENYEPATTPSWIQRTLSEMEQEGAALVRIILEAPGEVINEIKPSHHHKPIESKRHLKRYLIDVMDWPRPKILKAFEEIEECLQA